MLKYIINLLTTATSIVTALLLANISAGATPISELPTENIAPSQLQQVSLNLISPDLLTVIERQTSQFPHVGCACANCTQIIERIS